MNSVMKSDSLRPHPIISPLSSVLIASIQFWQSLGFCRNIAIA